MRFFQQPDEPEALSLSLPPISLLSQEAIPHPKPEQTLWEDDLGLDELVNALALDRRHRSFVRGVLTDLQTDEYIISWRQAVLADFIANPDLITQIEDLLSSLAGLQQDNAMLGRRRRSLITETSDRLSELDLYTELIADLHTALDNANLQSEALLKLKSHLADLLQREEYKRLQTELPKLREPLQNIGSITIGINLDYDLRPTSAVLLSINSRDAGQPSSMLSRLLSFDAGEEERELRGIAQPHRFPPSGEMRRYHELFQDVDKLMQQTAQPIARTLRRYIKTNSQTLVILEPEFAFFIAAAKMVIRWQREGLPICKPQALPANERIAHIVGLYNAQLALRDEGKPVPSDVQFDDNGRVAVLTGPNSGGKTTYLRSVGVAQVLFQVGLFIPAQEAQISPVTRILTHFPRLETREQGRLAEEAERLRKIFTNLDNNSLVLLNETFSSTAFGEALYLAQDILSALCAFGTRSIFATHLVELTEQFEQIEGAVTVNSRLCSLVAGIELDANGIPRPTYQVKRGEPLGRSYAREIARQYGISLEQILKNGA